MNDSFAERTAHPRAQPELARQPVHPVLGGSGAGRLRPLLHARRGRARLPPVAARPDGARRRARGGGPGVGAGGHGGDECAFGSHRRGRRAGKRRRAGPGGGAEAAASRRPPISCSWNCRRPGSPEPNPMETVFQSLKGRRLAAVRSPRSALVCAPVGRRISAGAPAFATAAARSVRAYPRRGERTSGGSRRSSMEAMKRSPPVGVRNCAFPTPLRMSGVVARR